MTAARSATLVLAWVIAFSLAPAAVPTAWAERPGLAGSQWQEELEKVDAKLRAGKWKRGKNDARRLAEEISRQSWYGVELRRFLADLAFYQAAGCRQSGPKRRGDLVLAHGPERRSQGAQEGLSPPYGEAGKLLSEFYLRKRGEAPARFRVVRPGYGKKFSHPAPSDDWAPSILLPASPSMRFIPFKIARAPCHSWPSASAPSTSPST